MGNLAAFILLLFPLLVVFIVVIANVLRSRQNQKVDWKRVVALHDARRQVVKTMDDQRWDVWQAFAEANGLTLTRHITSFSNDVHISGEYRGHHLVVEIRMATSEVHIGGNTTTIRAVLNARTSEKHTEALMRQLAELTPPHILNILTTSGFSFLPGTFAARDGGKSLSYEEITDMRESDKLRRIADGLSDLAEGYPAVAAAGGAAAPALQALVKEGDLLRGVIIAILKDIAQATRYLGDRAEQLLCPHCLACFGPHRVDLPLQSDVTYYGCRVCHQSREFIDCPRGRVAVLNAGWQGAQALHNGLFGVNWLARRTLFDFDRVEIVQATDKDVEHFAMQVGNDTDPFRKLRYAEMRCVVNPSCGLSENTLRILENTFGQVDA